MMITTQNRTTYDNNALPFKAVEELMNNMRALFGKDPIELAPLRMAYSIFQHEGFTLPVLQFAVYHCCQRCKYLPTVAQICEVMNGSDEDRALQSFNFFQTKMASPSTYSLDVYDPCAAYALRSVGGVDYFYWVVRTIEGEAKFPFLKKDYLNAYKTALTMQARGALPNKTTRFSCSSERNDYSSVYSLQELFYIPPRLVAVNADDVTDSNSLAPCKFSGGDSYSLALLTTPSMHYKEEVKYTHDIRKQDDVPPTPKADEYGCFSLGSLVEHWKSPFSGLQDED